jgi:hypothetical protein
MIQPVKGVTVVTRQTVPRLCGAVVALAFLFCSAATFGAQISGVVTNDRGSPLAGVPVCLKLDEAGPDCLVIRTTDGNGEYIFTSVEPAGKYFVEVFATFTASPARSRGNASTTRDRGARATRFSDSLRQPRTLSAAEAEPRLDRYSNYVWTPELAAVSVVSGFDVVGDVDFTGTFNFSNYQRSIRLTSEHFPLLEGFDLDGSFVFLKLYTFEGSDERLLFLGQVANSDALLIEVSLPLSVNVLLYDVFSPEASVSGSIQVSTGWSETQSTETVP